MPGEERELSWGLAWKIPREGSFWGVVGSIFVNGGWEVVTV
jgi:hypothetical protein